MQQKPYYIKKIYLKTLCCQTYLCLKQGDEFIKLIPVKTESGLIWMPETNELKCDYFINIKNKCIVVVFPINKKKFYYLTNIDNYVTNTKKISRVKYFSLNNLILDSYNNSIKLITIK